MMVLASSLVCAEQAFAHRPYERVAGSFTRSDGVTVSVIAHYIDGIIGADPVAVQFRLPGGTMIAETDRSRDGVVVRSTPLCIEVYRFPTDWIPIASSVQGFDGYALRDITTPRTQVFSVWAHTCAHFRAYVTALGFAVLLAAAWLATRAVPKRGWLTVLRVVIFLSLSVATGIYALLVFVAAPVSPFILCILGAVCVAFGFPLRRLVRHA